MSAPLEGHCDDRFAPVADVFQHSLDAGTDLGASVAVSVEGELVVDLWGGWTDPDRDHRWERDTITNVWSSTKTMVALCALLLVERGQLDVDARVADHWPEFAANGKGDIRVRHLLAHTSGLSGWDQPVVIGDLYDWDRSTAMLAAQAPWWEPGTASGYHSLSYGHLVGEVIRRVTAMKPGDFFAQEIARPLGADFHIGLDPSDFDRVANVVPPPPPPAIDPATVDMDSVMMRTYTGPAPVPGAQVAWAPDWRRADIAAANGHGNARSMALVQSVVSNLGAAGGIRLLSPSTVELIFREQANGIDLVLGVPLRFGIGYALANETFPDLPSGRVCFWSGWGGSLVVNDVDRRVTLAYAMNRMGEGPLGVDERGLALARATFGRLGALT